MRAASSGKDAILSGPAGGIVGTVRTAAEAGFDKIIGFDMGGTSTDVSHYAGEYERTLRDDGRGRAAARADDAYPHGGGGRRLDLPLRRRRAIASARNRRAPIPGPACYRRGGPLTVTDCNVMLGRLAAATSFRACSGPRATRRSTRDGGRREIRAHSPPKSPPRPASGASSPQEWPKDSCAIAVENMANAIKQISIERGYDVTEYTLCCFGGAGGQHACLVADALGMTRISHPSAGRRAVGLWHGARGSARLIRQEGGGGAARADALRAGARSERSRELERCRHGGDARARRRPERHQRARAAACEV